MLNGHSSCILAYGQTGSGKTFSIYGKNWDNPLATPSSSSLAGAGNGNNNSSNSNGINNSSSSSSSSISSYNSSNRITGIESNDAGILPRSLVALFGQLEALAQSSSSSSVNNNINSSNSRNLAATATGGLIDFEYSVSCQVIQVYNDRIYDCVSDKRLEHPLAMRDDKEGNTFIKGLSTYPVLGPDDVFQLIKKTIRNRVTR